MIRIEILCDWREQPAARDPKQRCLSLDNSTPIGEAYDQDTAASMVRTAASRAGWWRKSPPQNRNRSRMGWICPRCRERVEADEA